MPELTPYEAAKLRFELAVSAAIVAQLEQQAAQTAFIEAVKERAAA